MKIHTRWNQNSTVWKYGKVETDWRKLGLFKWQNKNLPILPPFLFSILTNEKNIERPSKQKSRKPENSPRVKGHIELWNTIYSLVDNLKGKGNAADQHRPPEQKVLPKNASKNKPLFDAPKEKGQKKGRSRRTRSVELKVDQSYGSSHDFWAAWQC